MPSMKELAVLKWHKDGCYAVDFAKLIDSQEDDEVASKNNLEFTGEKDKSEAESPEAGKMVAQAPRRHLSLAVSPKERREYEATHTHWIAAGSKDGKVSLWEIF